MYTFKVSLLPRKLWHDPCLVIDKDGIGIAPALTRCIIKFEYQDSLKSKMTLRKTKMSHQLFLGSWSDIFEWKKLHKIMKSAIGTECPQGEYCREVEYITRQIDFKENKLEREPTTTCDFSWRFNVLRG